MQTCRTSVRLLLSWGWDAVPLPGFHIDLHFHRDWSRAWVAAERCQFLIHRPGSSQAACHFLAIKGALLPFSVFVVKWFAAARSGQLNTSSAAHLKRHQLSPCSDGLGDTVTVCPHRWALLSMSWVCSVTAGHGSWTMLPAEAALGQPCSYLAGQGTMWTFSMCCMSSLLTSTVGPASWCSDPTRTLKLKEGLELGYSGTWALYLRIVPVNCIQFHLEPNPPMLSWNFTKISFRNGTGKRLSLSCAVQDRATKSCDFTLTKCLNNRTKAQKLSWVDVLSEGSKIPEGLPNAIMPETGYSESEGTDRYTPMYKRMHVDIHIYKHIQIHKHVNAHTQNTHLCIYMYVYI